jgi:hypothetical protein
MDQRRLLDVRNSQLPWEVSRINRHRHQWRTFPSLPAYGTCSITSSSQNLVDNAQHTRSHDTLTLAPDDWAIIDKSFPCLQGMPLSSTCLRLCHSPKGQRDTSITDTLLENISHHLSQIEHLNLAGCPRVTNEGVWSIIRYNVKNIKELALENLSPDFASFILLPSSKLPD